MFLFSHSYIQCCGTSDKQVIAYVTAAVDKSLFISLLLSQYNPKKYAAL